jgi:hypothetical protein
MVWGNNLLRNGMNLPQDSPITLRTNRKSIVSYLFPALWIGWIGLCPLAT